MNISGKAISSILSARGLESRDLSRRAGIPSKRLEAALSGQDVLDDDEVRTIADELAVPVHALFARSDVSLLPSVDFRSPQPGIARLDNGVLRAFQYVEKLSATFQGLGMDFEPSSFPARVNPDLTRSAAVELAKKWRQRWGYSLENQLDDGDANKVYTSLRSFIEGLGVMVVHFSFQTDGAAGIYARLSDGPHTIVVNSTGSSKARKLFTLAHEFGHVLLRQEGASNPSVLRNKIERFCNYFAAHLLAPTALIKRALRRFGYTPSADNNFIRLFAKKIGLSQEATFRRLVELDFLTQEQYGGWKSQFSGVVPTGDMSDGGGRGDPLQNKRTQYGSTLLDYLSRARREGFLDEIDIYRLCGLKPKYQNQLLGTA